MFPIFIVILAVCIDKERLTWPKLLLMFIGILGSFIIISNGRLASFALTNLWGDLSNWIVPDWSVLSGIAWLALSNIVMSYFIWFRVLQIAPTALVSGISFITPFVTLLFIFLLLGEKLSWAQGGGFILIMIGVLVYRRLERDS